MDFEQISRSLLPLLGGKENIASAAHCATRLRLVLVDDSLADQQAIGKIDGVKGCFRNAGQMQIIFGTGVVNLYPGGRDWRIQQIGSCRHCGEKTESFPAHCPPVVEHLCADHPGYRRLRPVDGPSGDG